MMNKTRALTLLERALVKCLLDQAEGWAFDLDFVQVQDMKDGGMGSIRFVRNDTDEKGRIFGSRIAEREFQDADGVPILVSLNVDQDGHLFELDIWKVDFSPTKKYPECDP